MPNNYNSLSINLDQIQFANRVLSTRDKVSFIVSNCSMKNMSRIRNDLLMFTRCNFLVIAFVSTCESLIVHYNTEKERIFLDLIHLIYKVDG